MDPVQIPSWLSVPTATWPSLLQGLPMTCCCQPRQAARRAPLFHGGPGLSTLPECGVLSESEGWRGAGGRVNVPCLPFWKIHASQSGSLPFHPL